MTSDDEQKALATAGKLGLAQDLIQEAYYRFLEVVDGTNEDTGEVNSEDDVIFVKALLGKAEN